MTPSMMNTMHYASPHRDVLDAEPDTEESKAKLVEELQNRGRAAVGAKSWMDAKLLYEKALTVIHVDDPSQKSKIAVLEANLSLVHKTMGNLEAAKHCAEKATEADPSYVKGWWRLGQALQALNLSSQALKALGKAKELEPSNKALVKEYEKVQKQVQDDEASAKKMEDTPMEDATSSTTTTTTKPKTIATSSSTTTNKSDNKKNNKESTKKMQVDCDEDDDEALFTKSEPVRGYKVVNGKKTSYFHNELSEEAKTLIGDIAPKKLNDGSSPTNATTATTTAPPPGASAWNQAGTWEERDVTKWAKESLEQQILQTTYVFPASSPAPGALVTVEKVTKLDGHASFAIARGKKRYIYEFMVQLEWKVSDDTSDLECCGSLSIPDVDGTIDLGEGYDVHDFIIRTVSDNSVRPLLDRFVHRGGFHDALNESIDDWVRKFKKEY